MEGEADKQAVEGEVQDLEADYAVETISLTVVSPHGHKISLQVWHILQRITDSLLV